MRTPTWDVSYEKVDEQGCVYASTSINFNPRLTEQEAIARSKAHIKKLPEMFHTDVRVTVVKVRRTGWLPSQVIVLSSEYLYRVDAEGHA